MPTKRIQVDMKKWQDYLRDSERDELEMANSVRDGSRELATKLTRKYKSRAESRMRAEKDAD